jgi:hypothetical protein
MIIPGRPARGKRGGQHKRAEKEPKHNQSMTAIATEQGIYNGRGFTHTLKYDGSRDVVSEVVVPDHSLTKAQHLTLFDKRDGLLYNGNPFAMQKGWKGIKRKGSRSNTIRVVPNDVPMDEHEDDDEQVDLD